MTVIRYILVLLLLLTPVSAFSESISNQQVIQNFDSRLLGKWQSDREKTLEWLKENMKLTQEKIDKLDAAIKFGTLVVEYTEDSASFTYDGETSVEEHKILGTTCNSVAFVTENPLSGEEQISIIRFENSESYSIYIDWADIREYFKKIK